MENDFKHHHRTTVQRPTVTREELEARLLDIVDGGASSSYVIRKMQGLLTGAQISVVLDGMAARGMVTIERRPTKGRPLTIYRLVQKDEVSK